MVGFKTSRLDESLIPYIADAHDWYLKDYNRMQNREQFHYLRSLKYFGALSRALHGQSYTDIARQMKLTRSNVRNAVRATENKVKIYLKLKELGRL